LVILLNVISDTDTELYSSTSILKVALSVFKELMCSNIFTHDLPLGTFPIIENE
jgi:hypothetical protein